MPVSMLIAFGSNHSGTSDRVVFRYVFYQTTVWSMCRQHGGAAKWLQPLSFLSGTHYLRGVNNSVQPWATAEGRKQFGLKPANPTEEGLASLHSVLLRKQPYLWRAALLYYTVYHATSMSFSQLFSHIARFVQDPDVRWEYCLRAKRGQTDTSQPGERARTNTHKKHAKLIDLAFS